MIRNVRVALNSVGSFALLFTGCMHHPAKMPIPVSQHIVFFQAEPRTILQGQSATLRWKTPDAEDVLIDQDPPPSREPFSSPAPSVILGLPSIGELTVQPRVTTTYILSCKGASWSACASATVRVKVAPAAKSEQLVLGHER